MNSRITKITIGRLYNLGSYEHVRYELTVEVPEGDSATAAVVAMEKILAALSPKTSSRDRSDLEGEKRQVEEMRALLADPEGFRRRYGTSFVGTPEEYTVRCEESHAQSVARRDAWEAKCKKARGLFDDLGGAAQWKDAKLDWEDEDQY